MLTPLLDQASKTKASFMSGVTSLKLGILEALSPSTAFGSIKYPARRFLAHTGLFSLKTTISVWSILAANKMELYLSALKAILLARKTPTHEIH